MVVIDPKGENAMVTARARGKGSKYSFSKNQTVRILDPCDTVKTSEDDFRDVKACFNPLDALSATKEESVDDAARIAEALIVSENSNDPFWEESARAILKALILYVLTSTNFSSEERNLNTVRKLIMAGDQSAHKLALALARDKKKVPSPFVLLYQKMQKNNYFGGVVANAGTMMLDMDRNSPRTLASTMQVVRTNTEFMDSPAMKRVMAKSDFALHELKTNPKGMSLFICLPQRFVDTHYRWLRMMTALTITEMEKVRQQPANGHRVLMVLDEFPALKRMRIVENAAAQIAGFGVKLMFVTQTLAQLKDIYKDNWETLLANAAAKLFFCIEDNFTRDYVSKLIGECEVVKTVHDLSGTSGQSESSGTSTSHTLSQSRTVGVSSGAPNKLGLSMNTVSESVTQGVSFGHTTSQSQGIAV